MSFNSDIDKWIAQMESLKNLTSDASEKIVPEIEDVISAQVSSGSDPYGNAWKKDKDGRQALQGIDKYVTVQPTNQGFKASLSGPAVYHQEGGGNLPQRKIIPDGPIPSSWKDTIKEVLDQEFKDKTK